MNIAYLILLISVKNALNYPTFYFSRYYESFPTLTVSPNDKQNSTLMIDVNIDETESRIALNIYQRKILNNTNFFKTLSFSKKTIEDRDVDFATLYEEFSINDAYSKKLLLPEIKIDLVNSTSTRFVSYTSLGFGFDIKDEEYSMTHLLYNKNMISKKQFSLVYYKDGDEGFIYFGGIPESYIDFYNKAEIKITKKDPKWNCELSQIIIDQASNLSYYNKNKGAYFTFSTIYIEVPKDAFDFIVRTYLGSNSWKFCKFYKGEYQCNPDIFLVLKPLTFVINNIMFTFQPRDLFNVEYYATFLFKENKNKRDSRWKLGSLFILKYLTTFDYERKSITFWAKEPFFQDERSHSSVLLMKILMKILTCILIVSSILLLINYRKKTH